MAQQSKNSGLLQTIPRHDRSHKRLIAPTGRVGKETGNTFADTSQFDRITQRINGDQNGVADRQALYAQALKVMA